MKTLLTPLAVAIMAISANTAFAQQTAHTMHHTLAPVPPKMAPAMEMCKKMMADMEMDKTHVKEMDAKLDGLVATMDAATGEDRVTATVAVVKELIYQRSMMRMMKEKMDAKMMAHMIEHMKMPMKSGKMDCPMMKGMTGGY